ncbi:hypothetical protein M3Y97_00751700 [Aphelenchoides bicaudatus]|nr:hypothetical protein M3Y97_00751700 [Aphelenchoides bicaudatus]
MRVLSVLAFVGLLIACVAAQYGGGSRGGNGGGQGWQNNDWRPSGGGQSAGSYADPGAMYGKGGYYQDVTDAPTEAPTTTDEPTTTAPTTAAATTTEPTTTAPTTAAATTTAVGTTAGATTEPTTIAPTTATGRRHNNRWSYYCYCNRSLQRLLPKAITPVVP